MQSQNQSYSPSPEVQTQDMKRLLVELRQKAVAEGIALSKIDEYIMGREDVPDGVKALIREEVARSADAIPDAAAERMEEASPVTGDKSASVVAEKTLSGEVEVFDAKKQIEQIKKETREGESTVDASQHPDIPEKDAAAPAPVEVEAPPTDPQKTPGTETTRSSLGVSGYQPSERIAQNAEEIAKNGDPAHSETWQAALLHRFMEIWGSFKAIFSSSQ